MAKYQLAQLNIARMKYPLESPGMGDFVANLEDVNALADASPGFVWRLQSEDGDATSIRFFGPDTVVNMSVWEDVASLHGFVYRSAHTAVMGRRKEWFERMREAYTVLWWIPRGSLPTLEQARSRLELLRSKGPTEAAFTFKKAFAAPDTEREIDEFEDLCPAT
ncbi:MAG: DUF3291 domain-containing protein [Arenicellales bacterium]|jgi:hypothetical protein